jgi:hypothetical protein
MRKKNGVNIMLFVIIIILIGILSCSKSYKNQTAGILLQTDGYFSVMSVKEGRHKAFFITLQMTGQSSDPVPKRQRKE